MSTFCLFPLLLSFLELVRLSRYFSFSYFTSSVGSSFTGEDVPFVLPTVKDRHNICRRVSVFVTFDVRWTRFRRLSTSSCHLCGDLTSTSGSRPLKSLFVCIMSTHITLPGGHSIRRSCSLLMIPPFRFRPSSTVPVYGRGIFLH